MLKITFIIGACCVLAACSAGSVGGTYDGVPLTPTDTQRCTTAQGEITAPDASDRQIQLRCGPQTQPLVSS